MINLINRNFLKTQVPDATIYNINIFIKVKKINLNEYNINEYVVLRLYFAGKDQRIIIIEKKLYLINDLRINALINIDIINSEKIVINIYNAVAIIGIYNNIIIFLIIKTRVNEFVRRLIYFINTVIILSEIYKIISISGYYGRILYLFINRDLLFEPNCLNHLNIYVYVIDSTITQIFVKNNTENEIQLKK